jgi:hypothetical protein
MMIPAVLAMFEAAVEKRINGCPFARVTDFEIATDAGISMRSVIRAKRLTKRFTVTSNGREPTVYREAEVAPISPNETYRARQASQIGEPDRRARQARKRSQPIDSSSEPVPASTIAVPVQKESPPIGPPQGGTPPKKLRGQKPRSFLPEDWQPDAKGIAYAKARQITPDEVPKFCNYWLSRGKAMADWSACWRTWCDNAVKYRKQDQRKQQPLGLGGYEL